MRFRLQCGMHCAIVQPASSYGVDRKEMVEDDPGKEAASLHHSVDYFGLSCGGAGGQCTSPDAAHRFFCFRADDDPYLDALFTSATSVCVTGLTVVDTFSHWSLFGKIVILLLIQLGGLGVISFTTGIMVLIGRKITLKGPPAAGERLQPGQSVRPAPLPGQGLCRHHGGGGRGRAAEHAGVLPGVRAPGHLDLRVSLYFRLLQCGN